MADPKTGGFILIPVPFISLLCPLPWTQLVLHSHESRVGAGDVDTLTLIEEVFCIASPPVPASLDFTEILSALMVSWNTGVCFKKQLYFCSNGIKPTSPIK
jgi:hypothetical protein